MKGELIGREKEKKVLQRALDSNEAEMVKQLSRVFISTFGLKTNSHSLSLIFKSLTMDDLFLG